MVGPESAGPPEWIGELRSSIMRLRRRLSYEQHPDNPLSLSTMAVLGALNRRGEMTIGQLAGFERVRPPTMTRTVKCLVADGLLTRRQHETDGRQVLVDITDAGRALLLADRSRRDQWLTRRLEALDPEELDLLHRVTPILHRLATED